MPVAERRGDDVLDEVVVLRSVDSLPAGVIKLLRVRNITYALARTIPRKRTTKKEKKSK